MLKELLVGKVSINVDLEKIIKNVSNWKYFEEEYDGIGNVETVTDFSVSKEEFEQAVKDFLARLNEYKNNEELFVKKLNKSLSTKKNGGLALNRRNIILKLDTVSNYNNEYGSHSYHVTALMCSRDEEFKGTISVSEFKEQSSF